jgi:predicted Zn finger-like uncharacterized protein
LSHEAARLANAAPFLFTASLASEKKVRFEMILTCPECGTQYVVKDGAIPPGGRQVRCASCRHSWHQDPEDETAAADDAAPADAVLSTGDDAGTEAAAPVDEHETVAEILGEDAAGDEAGEPVAEGTGTAPAYVEAREEPPVQSPPGDAEDEFTPFAMPASAEPRRRSPAFGVLVAVVLIVAAALAFWFLAPAEWKARMGLAQATDTPLQLMMTHSDRQRLASGNELLAISGRVINPTEKKQTVPPITAQLRDSKGRLVYSWTIAPPAPSLKAGDSASFYSAEVNVPAGGDELTVTLGAPKA